MRTSLTHSAFHDNALTVEKSASSFFATLAMRFREWCMHRAVLSELHRLDRATLEDLRIYPSDFTAIANGTYERGPFKDEPMKASTAGPRAWPL